jgi:hypothetical protein
MSPERIRELCELKPFRPFSVHLADGQSIPVNHPEFVFIAPNKQEVIIYGPDDSFNLVYIFSITAFKRRAHTKPQRK